MSVIVPTQPTFPYSNGTASTQNTGQPVTPYSGNTVQNPYGPSTATRVSFQFWRQPVYQLQDGTYWTPGCDGPTYATSPWDYLYIGLPTTGTPQTPGLITVNPLRQYAADKKKPSGSNGGRLTIHGLELGEVDIELRIWTPEQLRQFAILWPILFPASNKGTPPVYDCQHPALAQGIHGIKSLQRLNLRGPRIDRDGMGYFQIKATEFLKPSSTKATKTETAPLPTLYDSTATPSSSTPGSNSANLGP